MQRQALSTLPTFWDSINAKGTGQETTNPHVLAKRIVSSGKPITAEDINKVLAHKGIYVTEEELELLKTVKAIRLVKPLLEAPSYSSVMGVYCLVNLLTKSHYFGSSNSLGERIRDYLTFSISNKLRPVLQNIVNSGIDNFVIYFYV